jgi:hypothetical protein
MVSMFPSHSPQFGSVIVPLPKVHVDNSQKSLKSITLDTKDKLELSTQKISNAKKMSADQAIIEKLKQDPVFKNSGLTPALATEQDLPLIAQSFHKHISDRDINFTRLSLLNRSDAELLSVLPLQDALEKAVPDKAALSKLKTLLIEQFKSLINNPEAFRALVRGEMFEDKQEKMIAEKQKLASEVQNLKQRFLNNPNGALLMVKNDSGEIIGYGGINQLQNTHDFQMEKEIHDGIAPKHALLSRVFITPEARSEAADELAHKLLTTFAHGKGYDYLWSADNALYHGSTKTFHPLTETTVFPQTPVFTPTKNKQLMNEYNVGGHQLGWIPTH